MRTYHVIHTPSQSSRFMPRPKCQVLLALIGLDFQICRGLVALSLPDDFIVIIQYHRTTTLHGISIDGQKNEASLAAGVGSDSRDPRRRQIV